MSDSTILLDNNECIFNERHDRFARYGERRPALLIEQMARTYGCAEDFVLPTRGAEDAIDLLIRALCRRGDDVVVCGPTFDLFEKRALLNGVYVTNVERTFQQKGRSAEFRIDWPKLFSHDFSRTKIVYLVHPNNPTGEPLAQNRVEELAAQIGSNGIVLIDEAYIEFTYAASMIELLSKAQNIVVVRTLSKSWGAADLRCGAIVAHPHILEKIAPHSSFYTFSNLILDQACSILAAPKIMEERIASIKSRKKKLAAELLQLEVTEWAIEADAPFVLASLKTPNPGRYLLEKDIRVRFGFKSPTLNSAIRISIGTEREMAELITVLSQAPY